MKLFLDDERVPPELEMDWVIIRTYEGFTRHIETHGLPEFISFDHDLGLEKTGYDCAKWLTEYCMDRDIRLPEYYVHSQNPVGRDAIVQLLERFKELQEEDWLDESLKKE